MVEGFLSIQRRLDENRQVVLYLVLPYVFDELTRTQAVLPIVLYLCVHRDDTFLIFLEIQ